MNSERLSPRQLAVAVMVGGLSAGAAAAGRADWRWLLACVPVGAAAGWLVLRRVGLRPLHPALRVLYAIWAVMLMADALERTAERIWSTAGGQGEIRWLLALLALPLVWMGWGKAAAFFRAVEVFWLAAGVTAAAVLLLGAPRINWSWVLEPAGGWMESVGAGVVILSTGLFAIPHLYKVEEERSGAHWGLVWLGALGLFSALLALLTAGLLSPGVAVRLDGPFFAAAGLLGDTARLEGLISALWLLPDLTLVGLLSRSWGEERWPALAVLAALGAALTGVTGLLPGAALPFGCVLLLILTIALTTGVHK